MENAVGREKAQKRIAALMGGRALRVGLLAWGVLGFQGMAAGEPVDAGRQIEYVEARLQDRQCFDTDVPLKTTTRIVMDFQYSVDPGNTSQFNGASYFNPGFMWGVHEGYFGFHTPVLQYVNTSVPADASRHVFDIASGSQKLDDEEIATVDFQVSGTTVAHVYLFGYLAGVMEARGFSTMRLYSCQIYDGATLVRDYVPWMRGGVAGLYDRVNNRFSICFTKAQLMGPMYHDVAYVESDGSEYVDTGYVPNLNTKVVLDCQYLTTSIRQLQGFNGSATTTDFAWGIDAGYFRTYEWTTTTGWRGNRAADTDRHVFTFEDGKQTIDGEDYTTARMAVGNAGTAEMSLYLFARKTSWTGTTPCESNVMRLFGCQIYEGDTLVRDYRPCSSNGVAGLMETVSSNFVHLTYNFGTKMRCSPGATNMIDCAAIEMVGSQFLDTGVTPTKQTRMVLDCQYTALPASGSRYLAGVNSNSGYDFSWGINGDGQFVTYLRSGSWQIGPAADTKRHVWDLGPGTQKVDATLIATQTPADKTTQGLPIYLGARHVLWSTGSTAEIAASSAVAEPNCVRIYGCRFYEGDALTHDLAPCFCEGNAGLRDKVTGAFLPIEAQTAGRRSGGIFAPFAEEVYDYIESTGSQYVDTEVRVTDKLKVVLDSQYRNTSARQLQGYNNNSSVDFAWGIDNGYFRTFNCNSSAWAGNTKADLQRHVFTFENGKQTIDGADYTTAAVRGTNPSSDQVLYLFARLVTWSPFCQNHCFMRLYSSQIYQDGELVRDFVPARALGFTCLYDLVNNRPYLPHGGDFLFRAIPPKGTMIIIR